MEKKLQVFISSTYSDLLEERQAAIEAILDSGNIPAGMELFKSGKKQMETIQKWIDESDVYMLILGGRYGSIESDSGKSYTQLEYEYALSKNMPVFAVVIDEDGLKEKVNKWVARGKQVKEIKEIDNCDKYDKFKEIVKGQIISFYTDIKDIKIEVHRQINEIKKQDNLYGWVKGKDVLEEINQLREEKNQFLKIIYNNGYIKDDKEENKENFKCLTESEVIEDLCNYYHDLEDNGLENYLKSKYLSHMKQQDKDKLFRYIWQVTFVEENVKNVKDRKASSLGLHYLYNEDKEHYKGIIKSDEEYYFGRLNVETFKIQEGKNLYQQINEYSYSRIITLIHFIEDNNDIYTVLNDYAKNIIKTMVNHAFLNVDIEKIKLFTLGANEQNEILFNQQLILKAEAVFICENIEEHFDIIRSMISNYCATAEKWYDTGNYNVLREKTLERLYRQAKGRGAERQFNKFLISYCMNASSYYQAEIMIKYMELYIKNFNEEEFYFALAKMSQNSQYTDNNSRVEMIKIIEDNYRELFKKEILASKEEMYLYPNLYKVRIREVKEDVNNILLLIEKRAKNFSSWNLWNNILQPLIEGMKETGKCFSGNISDYVNIVNTLRNDDMYNRCVRVLEEVFIK